MRVNVKTDTTGTENIDWDHLENVNDVDCRNGVLRAHSQQGKAKIWDVENIEYYHVQEE